MKYFSLDDLEDPVEEKPSTSGIHVEKFLQLHEEKISSVKELTGRLPLPGEIYFLWTVKSFNAFTFIPQIIREHGVIDELILSTYSINIRIIDALARLIDKKLIHQVSMIISDSIKTRLPKVYDHLMVLVEQKPVRVRYAWTHAKISLIRSGENYYDVEGSGNWGENAMHEQYIITNSKKTFEFRKKEINGINAIAV